MLVKGTYRETGFLAYVGMGYLSWTLAVVIAGGRRSAIPFVASFVMVSWDLSMEPVWATVVHAWKWLDGGPYFGVPLSNFTGWFLTVWLIYQLFALFLGRGSSTINAQPIGYWREAIAFYAVSALGSLLLLLPHAGQTVVSDATGAQWQVASITAATALVSIFTMGAFALSAWLRTDETVRFHS